MPGRDFVEAQIYSSCFDQCPAEPVSELIMCQDLCSLQDADPCPVLGLSTGLSHLVGLLICTQSKTTSELSRAPSW